jgi:hypothetical protein
LAAQIIGAASAVFGTAHAATATAVVQVFAAAPAAKVFSAAFVAENPDAASAAATALARAAREHD